MNELSSLRLLTVLLAGTLMVSGCESDVTEVDPGTGGTTATGTGGTSTGGSGTGGSATGGSATGGSSTGGSGQGGDGGSGGAPSGVECNPSGANCAMPAPNCPVGQVPSVEGGCWGPCVPVLSCATEENCDNCQHGFCAAYEAWTIEYRCVMPYLQCSATVCACLAPYFCAPPFDACMEGDPGGVPIVRCGCPAC